MKLKIENLDRETVEALEDEVLDIARIETPEARKRALVSFGEGMAVAGLLAAAQASYALVGGHLDVKVMAFTAAQAFLGGCLGYIRQRAKDRGK